MFVSFESHLIHMEILNLALKLSTQVISEENAKDASITIVSQDGNENYHETRPEQKKGGE
jgi:hypothetical protein